MTRGELLRFRHMLLEKRKDIVGRVLDMEGSLQELQGRAIEVEEQAQQLSITEPYDQLDEAGKTQIDLIDLALRKMSLGEYGICESCGDEIGIKRLDAIPWARLCVDCAREFERKGMVLPEANEVYGPVALPDDYAGLSEGSILTRIYDRIHRDGRIDTQEMEISVRDGVVYLEGAIPSEQEHQILLETLTDVLGFTDVIDHLDVKEVLWERRDRNKGEKSPGLTLEDRLFYDEEEMTDDLSEAQRNDSPFIPPEKPFSEKEVEG